MREKGHVYDMMGRDADFYRDLFASLDNNAVLRRRNEQGVYVPVSCTREFTQMMVVPEDREDTAYLLGEGHRPQRPEPRHSPQADDEGQHHMGRPALLHIYQRWRAVRLLQLL